MARQNLPLPSTQMCVHLVNQTKLLESVLWFEAVFERKSRISNHDDDKNSLTMAVI